mgnify:CR=1 FL=1
MLLSPGVPSVPASLKVGVIHGEPSGTGERCRPAGIGTDEAYWDRMRRHAVMETARPMTSGMAEAARPGIRRGRKDSLDRHARLSDRARTTATAGPTYRGCALSNPSADVMKRSNRERRLASLSLVAWLLPVMAGSPAARADGVAPDPGQPHAPVRARTPAPAGIDARPGSSLAGESAVVRHVRVERSNVFDPRTATRHRAPRLINRFHRTTRDSVIRREIWFSPGDRVGAGDLEELERNLRALELFAEVDVSVEHVDDASVATDAVVDVRVSTTDRLSIVASTGGSYLGGIGEVSVSVGERNLAGLGHSIEFGYRENTEGELLGSFAYDDVRFASGDVVARFRLGQTEEGLSFGAGVRDEFDHSNDRLSWKIDYGRTETRVDYYEQGESVVEVPRETDTLSLDRVYRTGSRSRWWRHGVQARYKVTRHSDAIGADSDRVAIPTDSTELFIGGLLGYDAVHRHTRIRWLDTLDYRQDLSFGHGTELLLGGTATLDEPGSGIEPAVFLNYWRRDRLGADEYLGGRLETVYVLDGEARDSWSTSVRATLYSTRFRGLTLASSLRHATGFAGSGLPIEQTLGEDNGLRGYPARQFNGEQSVLLNLEGRLATPVRLPAFSLGAVAFVDAGWVGDRARNGFLDDPHTSAGVGVRLGSRRILGSAILRMDVAYPFDDDERRDYRPTLSLSLGQVFDFE